MAFKDYQCNSCGANLRIDLRYLASTCPYCGKTISFDDKTIAEIMAERERTVQRKKAEEEETKRVQAKAAAEAEKLKHDAEMAKISSDAQNFMEGANRVRQGLDTARAGIDLVHRILSAAGVIFCIIVALIIFLVVMKHI